MKFKFYIPLLIFLIMALAFWFGLHKDPHQINSPLMNKALPNFSGPNLKNSQELITRDQLLTKITVLNVFASWCLVCREENRLLMGWAHDSELELLGLNYRDNKADVEAWLNHYGDPYDKILFDPKGKVAIELGVYGTPETFLIDRKGIIRYKQIGSLKSEDWHKIWLPLIEQLKREK